MQHPYQQFLLRFEHELADNINAWASQECTRNGLNAIAQKGIQQVQLLTIGGGKRIRPYVAALFAGALDNEDQYTQVLPVLCAIELFHVFCLVHDDVIDRADTRRGLCTTHQRVLDELHDLKRRGEHAHLADGYAMLLGDLLFTHALHCLQGADVSPRVRESFFSMIQDVTAGQLLDVDLMTRKTVSDEALYQKTLLKTATYTFIWPMRMGLYAAGITDETVHNDVSSLGTHLGLAFQLQDDVLDVIADPKELKKPVLSDLEEGQHTYLTSHVRTRGTEEDQAQLDIWFGQSCEGVSQKEVIDFFERTGAISAVQSMITEHMTQAEQYTTSLKSLLSASQFRALTELIDRITHRST